ncbi:MAG: hypothetical protein V7647_2005 [Acidobacteriota bacterium]|jgi:hypothetical protein
MRRTSLGILFAAVMAALTLTAYAAAAKSYQFTGVVKSVDGATFTVQKSASETWEFSTDASTKGTPKVGDKVTVQYRMIATSIESKAAAGPAATKQPPAATSKPAAPAAKKK